MNETYDETRYKQMVAEIHRDGFREGYLKCKEDSKKKPKPIEPLKEPIPYLLHPRFERLGDFKYQCKLCGLKLYGAPCDSIFREHRCPKGALVRGWYEYNAMKKWLRGDTDLTTRQLDIIWLGFYDDSLLTKNEKPLHDISEYIRKYNPKREWY